MAKPLLTRRPRARRTGVKFWAPTSAINKPIRANPTLDANSAAIITAISVNSRRVATSIVAFGTPIYYATASTPRLSTIRVVNSPDWGPYPFEGLTIPMENAWAAAPGYVGASWADRALTIVDTDGRIFSFWQFRRDGQGPLCDFGGWCWGRQTDATITDDGTGNATGAGFSRLAGVVRMEELVAFKNSGKHIDHALVFATPFARPDTVVAPAKKTDGGYAVGGTATTSNSIPEAQRVFLDPGFNVAAMTGSDFQKAIAYALQEYGAYCIDNTGSSSAAFNLICETPPVGQFTDSGGYSISISAPAYNNVGVYSDDVVLTGIPMNQLRVMTASTWDSGT